MSNDPYAKRPRDESYQRTLAYRDDCDCGRSRIIDVIAALVVALWLAVGAATLWGQPGVVILFYAICVVIIGGMASVAVAGLIDKWSGG